jgi:hypothetical protein
MTDTRALSSDSAIDRIFGPVIHPQTWLNMVYLLVSFPLGITYFIILVMVFSTGLSLVPVFVGLFVLWFGLIASDVMADLDRMVANGLLGAGIPARRAAPPAAGSVFERMLAAVRRPGTMKRMAYLLLQLPMGILSFTFVTVLLPLSVILLTLPLTYTLVPVTVFGTSRIETFDEAIYLCCFGAVFTLLSVHALNSWSGLCRRFAQLMLR